VFLSKANVETTLLLFDVLAAAGEGMAAWTSWTARSDKSESPFLQQH
jgi:hypothetical protein